MQYDCNNERCGIFQAAILFRAEVIIVVNPLPNFETAQARSLYKLPAATMMDESSYSGRDDNEERNLRDEDINERPSKIHKTHIWDDTESIQDNQVY